MRVRAVAVPLLAGAAVVAVFVGTRAAHDPAAISAERPNQTRTVPRAAVATGRTTLRPTDKKNADSGDKPPPRPRSFRNTDVDGAVRVDSDGRVVPTRALRDLFDYYLSGVGEYTKSDAATAVKNQLRAYARANGLSGPARRQLLALFDRYMAYRRAAAKTIGAVGQGQKVASARALQRMSQLRIAYLGAEIADAFFDHEQSSARAAMARRQGRSGVESLTTSQKHAVAPVNLANRVSTLRESGAGEAAVAAARKQAVGRLATERLQALDAKRARWNETLEAYRRERDALTLSAMATTDRRQALTALRERYFSPRERRRVEALDRMSDRGNRH